jgi:hypothetical protein
LSGYLTKDACDTYASDGDGHCKYCSAGEFISRHFPDDLVMVCENCKQAINFDTQKVSKTVSTQVFLASNDFPKFPTF